MLLNKQSLGIAKLAPKEESRYTLNSILVTDKETVTTDGHMLTRVSHSAKMQAETFPVVPGQTGAPNGKGPIIIPASVALDALKTIPKKATIPILNNVAVYQSEDRETTTLVTTDMDSPRSYAIRKQTGQFPSWEAVWTSKKPSAEVTLDAKLLLQIAKAAVEFHDDKDQPASLRIQVFDAQTAVRFDIDNTETEQGFSSIIMPLRAEPPKFAYQVPQKTKRA